MEFIIISGQSGAGKSSAAAFLEDLGFYCVDKLPVALITSFAGICMAGAGTGKYSRVALVTDIRGGQTFDELFQALDELEHFRSRECAGIVEDLLRHALPQTVEDSLSEIRGQLKLFEDDNAEALLGGLLTRMEKEEG